MFRTARRLVATGALAVLAFTAALTQIGVCGQDNASATASLASGPGVIGWD
ncbi:MULTISPECIES: hypothetical protein [unclassified Streptomyces]|uniref:hypothetical protein n=1 Tax=unclassified Streptomyces TaxID=2593676 RepID=UPI0002F97A7E|nr:hypothetical protein [Streptomyces sp. e14]MYX42531.1 hypothetical protein [Streptomyces sp. SID89]NED70948.1 hypothetical protein [Streptomyces sp. SID9944]